MSDRGRRLREGLAQGPVIAALWLLHAVLLYQLFFAYFISEKLTFGQKLAVVAGLAALLVAEVALLALANLALELATPRPRRRWPLDFVKAAALALLVGALAASVFKFKSSSVHLKLSDLWFAYANFRQILAEGQGREVVALLAAPVAVVAIAAVTFLTLTAARRRGRGPGLRTLAASGLVAALALGGLWAASSPLRQFGRDFVPEIYWLAQRRPLAGLARTPASDGDAPGGPPIAAYAPGPAKEPLNVVLVMLESLPWKRTFLGGGDPALTPELQALARESVVFSRAYTPSTHSDYAQMAILSSLHPRKYDRHDYYVNIEYPRTLIWDALAAAGYTTGLFSCQNERWGNMLSYLNTPGLDVLRHSLDWPRARHRGRGASSKVYEETPVAEWIRWRGRGIEPYFSYLNFQATHFPYEAPPEAERPLLPDELDFEASYLDYPQERVPTMLNRFGNALKYSDAHVGKVVAHLKAAGEWDETALVVVSDHGEAFYEHGRPTHGSTLYEEEVRSFLLLRIPGEEPRTVDEPVSLLDVVPTVLRALGLPDHGNLQGRADLLDPGYSAAGRPLLFSIQGITAEDGILLDDWKYVVNWDRRHHRLVDLSSDPEELTDLSSTHPDRAAALRSTLETLLTQQLTYYRAKGWEQGRYPQPLP